MSALSVRALVAGRRRRVSDRSRNLETTNTMLTVGSLGPAKTEDIRYLSDRECRDTWAVMSGQVMRPWKLWCAEVEAASLYHNDLGSLPGA